MLDEFALAVGGDGVIIRNGYLVKSWGQSDRRGDWASAAKPVLSTLLFFAIEDGRLEGVGYLGVGSYGGGSDQDFPVPGVYGFNWSPGIVIRIQRGRRPRGSTEGTLMVVRADRRRGGVE